MKYINVCLILLLGLCSALLLIFAMSNENFNISIPNTNYYDNPAPNGCREDEVNVRLEDVDGAACAPKFPSGQCPVNTLSAALPMSGFQTLTNTPICLLSCNQDSDCPTDATCKTPYNICTYIQETKCLSNADCTTSQECVIPQYSTEGVCKTKK